MSLSGASNLILFGPDWSDNATLTASAENANAPASNLQDPRPRDIWVADSVASDLILTLDRGVPTFPFNGIFLGNTNASKTATWEIRAAATSGELDSNPLLNSGGGLGQKLALFGAESIVAPADAQVLDFGATGTLELLFRPKALGSMGLLRIHDGGANEVLIRLNGDKKLEALMTGDYSLVASAEVPFDGAFHHVALVHDTSIVRLYLNGSQVASGALGTPPAGMDEIEIAPSDPTRWFGDVDEFRLWSDVRTATEVMQNQMLAMTGAEAGLTVLWSMDEGSGTSVADNAGTAVNGTVTATAVWGYHMDLWASPELDFLERRNALFVRRPGIAGAQFVRITIKDTENSDGRFEAGRLVIGNGFYPSSQFLKGSAEFDAITAARPFATADGSPGISRKRIRTGAQLRVQTDEESEASLLKRIYQLYAGNEPVVLCSEPIDLDRRHEKLHYGLLPARSRVQRQSGQIWESQISVSGFI